MSEWVAVGRGAPGDVKSFLSTYYFLCIAVGTVAVINSILYFGMGLSTSISRL